MTDESEIKRAHLIDMLQLLALKALDADELQLRNKHFKRFQLHPDLQLDPPIYQIYNIDSNPSSPSSLINARMRTSSNSNASKTNGNVGVGVAMLSKRQKQINQLIYDSQLLENLLIAGTIVCIDVYLC